MPGWVSAAWNEYARRLSHEFVLELPESPLSARPRVQAGAPAVKTTASAAILTAFQAVRPRRGADL